MKSYPKNSTRTNTTPNASHQKSKRESAQNKTLRVIGGKYKGLKLYAPSSARPSKSILKESCFNILGNSIIGAQFIEAFSGSGSMGIEALSRGAKKAIFFEQDKEALAVLQKNLALLERHKDSSFLADSSALESISLPKSSQNLSAKNGKNSDKITQTNIQKPYQIIAGDSLQNLPPFLSTLEHLAKSNILYIDPPFFIRQNYADIYEKCANIIAHIHSLALQLVIIEHSSLYSFEECLGDFFKIKQRTFGKSTVTFFAPYFDS